MRARIAEGLQQIHTRVQANGWDAMRLEENLDAGYPFLSVDQDGAIHFLVYERGKCLQDRITGDVDEALYWAAVSTTSAMSSRWAAGRRDFRAAMWAHQAELLSRCDSGWARRRIEELRADVPDAGPLLPDPPS